VGHPGPALDQHLHHDPRRIRAPSSTLAEVSRQLQRRLDGGARWDRPRTTRSGCSSAPRNHRSPGGSRTVSAGSSARTVPAPTSTASDWALRRWASRRAAVPVIHRLVRPGRRCRRPVDAASLSTTHGRPVRRCLR
jgi:hypothetical protein